MSTCRLVLDADFAIAPVERRLFGSFVEHMGRCVYTGVFEPGHGTATEEGFRQDVLDLTREMGVSVVRYPGGNFVSGYRWEDGVGPVEQRPERLDLAWRSLESNRFGLHEFLAWADQAQVEPMLAVNLGTRGVQEAADLVEYANHPGGTRLSDQRRANGAPDPFGVRLWCLGNEMDGPWQIGHKTAYEYGRLAAEAAKAMRRVDTSLELVACGSSNRGMATFASWESTVLEQTYDVVDYISLHAYYERAGSSLADYLASNLDMDAFIDEVVVTADHVAARLRSKKRIKLSFDEWNVWSMSRFPGETALEFDRHPRLIEEEYSVADAVVVGSFLISLIRHADRMGVACQAQLANIIAPIRTEPGGPAWRQTIFYPFAQASRLARGQALQVALDAPRHSTTAFDDVALVDCAATWDAETGALALFLVNRNETGGTVVDLDLRAFEGLRLAEHLVLADDDLSATNTAEAPDRVTPRAGTGAVLDGTSLQVALPPVSWTVLSLVRA